MDSFKNWSPATWARLFMLILFNFAVIAYFDLYYGNEYLHDTVTISDCGMKTGEGYLAMSVIPLMSLVFWPFSIAYRLFFFGINGRRPYSYDLQWGIFNVIICNVVVGCFWYICGALTFGLCFYGLYTAFPFLYLFFFIVVKNLLGISIIKKFKKLNFFALLVGYLPIIFCAFADYVISLSSGCEFSVMFSRRFNYFLNYYYSMAMIICYLVIIINLYLQKEKINVKL